MLILIFFAFLVTDISVIKCIETFEEINVVVDNSMNCRVSKTYKIPAGTGVVVKMKNESNKKIINATVEKRTNNQTISEDPNTLMLNPLYISNDNLNKTHSLFFIFILKSVPNQGQVTKLNDRSMCETQLLYEPVSNTTVVSQENCFGNKEYWYTYFSIVGGVAGIVIIALLATTIYYNRQANMLSKDISLERRAERADEIDRYCSNPRKGKKVSPILNNNRDSDIYEDPKITLGVTAMPPAIPTTPRPNHNYHSTLKKPASPSMTLKSNASQVTLTRPRAPDKEAQIKLSMARRPPLPLPQDEFYSADPEDDTYEEPPVPERPKPTTLTKKSGQQERIGAIPKNITKPTPENIVKPRPEKVAKALEEKFGKTLPNIPMDGLKPPGVKQLHKPAIPNSKPTPPRNNVVQVPIRQIPEPSSLKKAPLVKPRPNVKPKTPPSPTLEQGQFFNDERRDSTDDEYWTYEPLPQYNIYNN